MNLIYKNKITLLIMLSSLGCSRDKTIHPQYKAIVEAVYASGHILPDGEYKVFCLSNGTITEKKVQDGDAVQANQVLFVVNNAAPSASLSAAASLHEQATRDVSENSPVLKELQLAVKNANAKFLNDSINYVRYSNLLKQDATSRSAYDNVKLNYDVSLNLKNSAIEKLQSVQNQLRVSLSNSQSQLTSAKESLNNYIIRSDSAGIVFQTFKELGETVRAGELLALLGKKDARIIRLSVDQQDINKIQIGQEILVRTDVTGKSIYTARVNRIYPVMNEADQTFRVDGIFADSIKMNFVHSSVEANIIIRKQEHTLVIPRTYLIGDDSLLVRISGEKKRIAIKTGILTLDEAEVISGIDEHTELLSPISK